MANPDSLYGLMPMSHLLASMIMIIGQHVQSASANSFRKDRARITAWTTVQTTAQTTAGTVAAAAVAGTAAETAVAAAAGADNPHIHPCTTISHPSLPHYFILQFYIFLN
jgi:hypothetical protein